MSQVKQSGYLIREVGNPSAVGARLWNLDAIRKDWQKSSGSSSSSCTDKIYKQAVDDQAEYWKFIGKKYSCGKDASNAPAESPCGRYAENSAYLGFTGAVLSAISDSKSSPCAPVSHPAPAARNLAVDVSKVVATPTQKEDDACLKVPEPQRRKPGEKNFVAYFMFSPHFKDCATGVIKQLMLELDGMKLLYEKFKSFASKQAENMHKAGWKTGMANAARAVGDAWSEDPLLFGVIEKMVTGAWRYATENFDDYGCFNNEEQTVRVCQILPKVGLALLTGKVLSPAYLAAGKGMQAAKTGMNAASAAALSTASKGLEAAASAATKTAVGRQVAATAETVGNAVEKGVAKAATKTREIKRRIKKQPQPEGMTDVRGARGGAANDSAKPSAMDQVRDAGKKVIHGGTTLSGKVIRAGINNVPGRELQDAHDDAQMAPVIEDMKAKRAREKKEAEARWRAEHPDEAAEEDAESEDSSSVTP